MDSGQSAASLLRDLRRKQGKTLRLAATELGVAPSQLSRMERGQRPITGAAEKLAEYYSVPINHLTSTPTDLPMDIVRILIEHPAEVERLRNKYA